MLLPPTPRPRTRSQKGCEKYQQVDEAEITIGDVVVAMTCRSNLDVPAEFSAYIPRAEIHRRFQNGRLSEEDIVLSSITIVHSPRHHTEQEPDLPNNDVRRWEDDKRTWSGTKVTTAKKYAPRVTFGGNPKALVEG